MKKLFKHYNWKKLIEYVNSCSDRIVKQEILSNEKTDVKTQDIDNKLKNIFKDLAVVIEIPVLSGLYKIKVPGKIGGLHDKVLVVKDKGSEITTRKLVIAVFRPSGSDKAFSLKITKPSSPRSYRIYVNETIETKDTLMLSHSYLVSRNRMKLAFQEFTEFMSLTEDPKLPELDFSAGNDETYLDPEETIDILRYCSSGCLFSGKSCPGPVCSISRLLSSSEKSELRSASFSEVSEGLILDKPKLKPRFLDTVKARIINWIEGNLELGEQATVLSSVFQVSRSVEIKPTWFGSILKLTGNLKSSSLYGDNKTLYVLDNGIEIIRKTDREKPRTVIEYF